MALDFQYIRKLLEARLEQKRQSARAWTLACLAILFVVCSFYYLCVKAPASFPHPTIVTVNEKTSLNEIAQMLSQEKIVKSAFTFRAGVIASVGEGGVIAGDYLFEKSVNVFGVIERLTHGDYNLTPVKVLLPEGITVEQMSTVLSNKLINFDAKEFVKITKPTEGYYFPDTYLFSPIAKPDDVANILRSTFDEKIKSIEPLITSFKKPLKDVVIMASILEAEARTKETRQIIAGILWKRLSLGMPLQVDAPFQYIIGKNTFQLTTADLKYDSPYNTYTHRGLPPGAINNPGLDALIDTVTPKKTTYFYYLSDVRGNMHYARTYEEHLVNIEKYLR